MRKGTPEFERLREAKADIDVRGDLVIDGELVASTHPPQGIEAIKINDGGNIKMDASNEVVGTGQIELWIPESLVPDSLFDPLMPVNTAELHLKTGYQTGQPTDMKPAAVMSIDTLSLEDHGDGIGLSGDMFDRSLALKDSVVTETFEILAGANVYEAISERVARVYPGLEVVGPQSGARLSPLEVKQGDSDLGVVNALASSVGWSFYFDATGVPTIRSHGEQGEAAFDWATGDHRILSVCRNLTRRQVYNAYILIAESTRDADENGDLPEPIIEMAFADHIDSPMYYDEAMFEAGAPGLYPLIYTTQALTDRNQVRLAARSGADRLVMQPESVSATVAPIPGLELFDTVSITHPRLKVSGLFTVGLIDRPLGTGWYGFGTNERRLGPAEFSSINTRSLAKFELPAPEPSLGLFEQAVVWFDPKDSFTGLEQVIPNRGTSEAPFVLGSGPGTTILPPGHPAYFKGGHSGADTNEAQATITDYSDFFPTSSMRIELDFVPRDFAYNGSIINRRNGTVWDIGLTTGDNVTLITSTDGTAGTLTTYSCTQPIDRDERHRIAIELTPGGVCTFYTRESNLDDWVQLGNQITDAAGWPIYEAASSDYLEVSASSLSYHPLPMDMHSAKVYVDGHLRAAPNFSAQKAGVSLFTDDADLEWEISSTEGDNVPVLLPHVGENYSFVPRTNGVSTANRFTTTAVFQADGYHTLDYTAVIRVPEVGVGGVYLYALRQWTSSGLGVLGVSTDQIRFWFWHSAAGTSAAFHASPSKLTDLGFRPGSVCEIRARHVYGTSAVDFYVRADGDPNWINAGTTSTGAATVAPTTPANFYVRAGGEITTRSDSFVYEAVMRCNANGDEAVRFDPRSRVDRDTFDQTTGEFESGGIGWESQQDSAEGIVSQVVTEPLALTDSHRDSFLDIDYTPDFTTTEGQLTVIWVGRVQAHIADYARLVSFETASNDGLCLMYADFDRFQALVGDGTDFVTANLNGDGSVDVNDHQLRWCAAVINNGTLSAHTAETETLDIDITHLGTLNSCRIGSKTYEESGADIGTRAVQIHETALTREQIEQIVDAIIEGKYA